jgi:hypothetical protein
MIFKVIDLLQPENVLDIIYNGTVVDNEDDKKLGRIKVEIKGLLEGDKDKLPWCYPLNGYGLGGNSDVSWFSVPEKDTQVAVVFPFKDIYSPMYIGYFQNDKTHQTDYDTNYPERYGWRDSTGNVLYIDKKDEEIKFTHSSGSTFKIDKDGNIEIENTGDVKWHTKGKVEWNADDDFTITASNIYLN